MKPLLMTGGIFVLIATSALGQTLPASSTPPLAAKAAEPGIAKPVETSTKSGSALEFKAADEKEVLPPPAPPVIPAVRNAPQGRRYRAAVSQPPPSPAPTGPRIVEAASGPAIIPDSSAPPGRSSTPSVAPLQASLKPRPYIIGPLDVLEIRVWNDQKLSGMQDVATDGTISMQLVGILNANGLTVAELTVALKEKLSAVIIEPEVSVQVVRINSKKYSIHGGCARQGEFPLIGEVTILDAFANCGGFKDFANLKGIYVLRGSQRIKFNYRDVIRGKHMEQNIQLENGDRIVIPE
ncbi:MAG: hypothetical protein JW395_2015 [Nitrospira sp.]|nr:hypothetical protein [Nitrospira sp.]